MSPGLADLAAQVLGTARACGLTLVTAESCTAGALAQLLAGAPGASESLHGGFVVYTKRNKHVALGVPADLIRQHTAVSREVVEAMARGALDRSPADVSVAITGVAGPEPDEDGNAVGLVHFAVAMRTGRTLHEQALLAPGSRDDVIERALARALGLADRALATHQAAAGGS